VNLRLDARILGFLAVVLGGAQVLPLATALASGESPWPWLACGAGVAGGGLSISVAARPHARTRLPRSSMALADSTRLRTRLPASVGVCSPIRS